jgi:DNA-binding transcriptional MerR regulator
MQGQPQIPDKFFFKIGEVSRITGLPDYVLRYWETEFSRIRPKRTAAGQRLYRKKDIECILNIKHLLHERRYTIEGARKHLNARPRKKKPRGIEATIQEIRRDLIALRKLIE